VGFLVVLGIACRKTVVEEEFFFSEEGFGRDWRGYVLNTGGFC
jgi:hypothetical protein